MLGDMVGAAGCDGQGNMLAGGMNTMFQQGGMMGMDPMQGHVDPMVDEIPEEMMHQGPPPEAAGWGEEFLTAPHMQQNMGAGPAEAMAQEFLQQQQMHEGAAAAAGAQDWAQEMQMQHPMETGDDWLEQFQNRQEAEDWADEFSHEGVQTFGIEGEPEIPFEEKQANSKFFEFLEKVKTGEIKLDDKDGMTADGEWGNEFAQQGEADWAEQFAHHDGMGMQGEGMQQDWANEFEGMGAQDWAKQFEEMGEQGGQDWAEEFNKINELSRNKDTEYQFEENNPYLFHENPFQEGIELEAAGSLAEAVLAFEAAVQQEKDHAEGWQHLGTCQAQNEKDVHAIAALSQCRKLEPGNSAVLMQLAVSYTNESGYADAIQSLRDWLLSHPKYKEHASQLEMAGAPQEAEGEEDYAKEYFFIQPKEHKAVASMFEAALTYGNDPEVSMALGVMYNMSHEYDKAVLHFQEALKGRPDDAKLWNKLGATLANGNRSGEALKAYNQALDINPGFVRAQYNLGIAYSNLGEHMQAAQYFLRSLEMQKSASTGGDGKPTGTQEMWDVLRMTFSLMSRQDLVELTWKQDPTLFQAEFGMGM